MFLTFLWCYVFTVWEDIEPFAFLCQKFESSQMKENGCIQNLQEKGDFLVITSIKPASEVTFFSVRDNDNNNDSGLSIISSSTKIPFHQGYAE